jgi:glycosyltransferase involved in cell wall biosynthesis
MKVLYFSRDYTTHDRRFLRALAAAGHEVAYLRLERGPYAFESRPLPPEVEIVRWAGGQGPARRQDGPRLLRDLRRVLRQQRPDVIQAGPIQTCAFLAALAGARPLVSTSWGSDLLKDAERSPLWRWATRYTLRRSDALVGDCEPVRQRAIHYGMAAERIITFPWGVELERFQPPAAPHDPATFTLLSTRAWEPLYGVETVARGFLLARARLQAEGYDGLRLIMLGSGSLAGRLHGLIQAAGALDDVALPGQVSQEDLPRFHQMADLYISASHSDGTSISLLEALATGRAVAVSDIPGNREWIEAGEQGWFFPVDDAEALAALIVAAVGDRARLTACGAAARQTAVARADWTRNFRQLLKAYDIARGNIGT